MKAILIIDMPSKCDDCPLLDTTDIVNNCGDFAYCHALHKPLKNISITQFINVRKPKNCPLKPMPQKRKIDNCMECWQRHYIQGINDTISQIEGTLIQIHSED